VEVANSHTQRTEKVYLALGQATGDNPFLAALSNTLPATAGKACKDCFIVGHKVGEGRKGATRFGGWSEPTAFAIINLDSSWTNTIHQLIDSHGRLDDLDEGLYVTHTKHLMRSAYAEQALKDAADAHPPCESGVPYKLKLQFIHCQHMAYCIAIIYSDLNQNSTCA
jgi:hypothetical protein